MGLCLAKHDSKSNPIELTKSIPAEMTKSLDLKAGYIEAFRYDTWVCEGIDSAIHGEYHPISERWIPKYGICVNKHAAFKSNGPRNEGTKNLRGVYISLPTPLVPIQVPDAWAKDVAAMVYTSKLLGE